MCLDDCSLSQRFLTAGLFGGLWTAEKKFDTFFEDVLGNVVLSRI